MLCSGGGPEVECALDEKPECDSSEGNGRKGNAEHFGQKTQCCFDFAHLIAD